MLQYNCTSTATVPMQSTVLLYSVYCISYSASRRAQKCLMTNLALLEHLFAVFFGQLLRRRRLHQVGVRSEVFIAHRQGATVLGQLVSSWRAVCLASWYQVGGQWPACLALTISCQGKLQATSEHIVASPASILRGPSRKPATMGNQLGCCEEAHDNVLSVRKPKSIQPTSYTTVYLQKSGHSAENNSEPDLKLRPYENRHPGGLQPSADLGAGQQSTEDRCYRNVSKCDGFDDGYGGVREVRKDGVPILVRPKITHASPRSRSRASASQSRASASETVSPSSFGSSSPHSSLTNSRPSPRPMSGSAPGFSHSEGSPFAVIGPVASF